MSCLALLLTLSLPAAAQEWGGDQEAPASSEDAERPPAAGEDAAEDPEEDPERAEDEPPGSPKEPDAPAASSGEADRPGVLAEDPDAPTLDAPIDPGVETAPSEDQPPPEVDFAQDDDEQRRRNLTAAGLGFASGCVGSLLCAPCAGPVCCVTPAGAFYYLDTKEMKDTGNPFLKEQRNQRALWALGGGAAGVLVGIGAATVAGFGFGALGATGWF